MGQNQDVSLESTKWRVWSSSSGRRGMRVDQRCQLCGMEKDTANHALFSCSLARQVRALVDVPIPPQGFEDGSIYSNIHFILTLIDKKQLAEGVIKVIPWELWFIWKERNKFLFEGTPVFAKKIAREGKEESQAWFIAQEETEETEQRN